MKRLIVGNITTDGRKLRLRWKGFAIDLAKNTRQGIRDMKFFWDVLERKVKVFETDSTASENVRRIIHMVQIREGLMVRTTREVSTPEIQTPMGQRQDCRLQCCEHFLEGDEVTVESVIDTNQIVHI